MKEKTDWNAEVEEICDSHVMDESGYWTTTEKKYTVDYNGSSLLLTITCEFTERGTV